MDYKVIITPRKLCDAGMEALAAQQIMKLSIRSMPAISCRSFKRWML